MPQTPLGERLALLTDLYQLTMAACYFDQEMDEEATFSLFIRKYPKNRGYFVAAGLSEALDFLAGFRFTAEDLAYLDGTGLFSPVSWTFSRASVSPARSLPCRRAASSSKTNPSSR